MPEEILNQDIDEDDQHFRSDELQNKIGQQIGGQIRDQSISNKSIDTDNDHKDFQTELEQLGQLDID